MTPVPLLLIRLSVSLIMLLFGANQLLAPEGWAKKYMPKMMWKLKIVDALTVMRLHSLGNIFLGLLFAIGLWDVLVGWAVLLWWLSILPFAFYGDWRIGMRDLTIIAALVAYILLL